MPFTRLAAPVLAGPILILSLGLAACSKPADQEAAVDEPLAENAHHAKAPAEALERTPAPPGAQVFFITPTDGATVSNPVAIEFGIEGMSVAKAGLEQPDSGHHHLLIDTDLPDFGLPIPADANHIHFGDGSTSTEISLEPGAHTLRMLLGDYRHVPHEPAIVSDPITISVE